MVLGEAIRRRGPRAWQDILRAAYNELGRKPFQARDVGFVHRAQRATGLGVALSRGVREGYLVVVRKQSFGRVYAFTDAGERFAQGTQAQGVKG